MSESIVRLPLKSDEYRIYARVDRCMQVYRFRAKTVEGAVKQLVHRAKDKSNIFIANILYPDGHILEDDVKIREILGRCK